MKQFMPFLLISVLLFVTMKAINHLYKENQLIEKPDKITPCTMGYPLPIEDSIIFYRYDSVYSRMLTDSTLRRAKPSDFKSYYFFNCKLLPVSSNGLCFSPGGYSIQEESRPLYDESWKRQFIQFI